MRKSGEAPTVPRTGGCCGGGLAPHAPGARITCTFCRCSTAMSFTGPGHTFDGKQRSDWRRGLLLEEGRAHATHALRHDQRYTALTYPPSGPHEHAPQVVLARGSNVGTRQPGPLAGQGTAQG